MQLTYDRYLKISELINLQVPLSEGPEHDETLFIIVHQIYELWFKQLIHELGYLQTVCVENRPAQALSTLKRILAIFRTIIQQVEVLETISPLSFLSFRGRLDSASGFQSIQFRVIEFILGQKNPQKVSHIPKESVSYTLLNEHLHRPTLWDSFLQLLKKNNYPVPDLVLTRDVTQPYLGSTEVQTILIDIYKTNPIMMQLCEYFIDLDAALQEWRYRHIKMVERTIGNKPGTGGSSGVNYLKGTLSAQLFPDLWAIRSSF